MWTPFGSTDENILISETIIYNYCIIHPEFKIDNLIDKYYLIYDFIGRSSAKDKLRIKKQINENIDSLIKKKILIKENGIIKKVSDLKENPIF